LSGDKSDEFPPVRRTPKKPAKFGQSGKMQKCGNLNYGQGPDAARKLKKSKKWLQPVVMKPDFISLFKKLLLFGQHLNSD